MLELLELLLPLGGLVSLAVGIVELHQALESLLETRFAPGRNFRFPLLHAFVTCEQQGFGIAIFFLSQKASAEDI